MPHCLIDYISCWASFGTHSDGRRGGVRNDRMVYIANIPYDVRWMELKDLVREKAGEVWSVT